MLARPVTWERTSIGACVTSTVRTWIRFPAAATVTVCGTEPTTSSSRTLFATVNVGRCSWSAVEVRRAQIVRAAPTAAHFAAPLPGGPSRRTRHSRRRPLMILRADMLPSPAGLAVGLGIRESSPVSGAGVACSTGTFLTSAAGLAAVPDGPAGADGRAAR